MYMLLLWIWKYTLTNKHHHYYHHQNHKKNHMLPLEFTCGLDCLCVCVSSYHPFHQVTTLMTSLTKLLNIATHCCSSFCFFKAAVVIGLMGANALKYCHHHKFFLLYTFVSLSIIHLFLIFTITMIMHMKKKNYLVCLLEEEASTTKTLQWKILSLNPSPRRPPLSFFSL